MGQRQKTSTGTLVGLDVNDGPLPPASTARAKIPLAVVSIFLLVLCSAGPAPASGTTQQAALNVGTGSFLYHFQSAGRPRTITVWYFMPAAAQANTRVVFVLHGFNRAAQNYRKYWIAHAERRGFILLVPEFSRAEFPGAMYDRGNMLGADGRRLPEAQWTYTAIEDIFDAVRSANALRAGTYDIYGHSAGGQFVHRLVLFKPSARFRVAVAANSGWYTMPDPDIAYPYGLGGAGVDEKQLAAALGRRLIVLLGGDDTDPAHPQLRRTPEAMRQGSNRLERGNAFYELARHKAVELQVPFNWSLQVVPGVAHSNARMAPAASEFLGGER